MMRLFGKVVAIVTLFAAILISPVASSRNTAQERPDKLSIDDVLAIEQVEAVALSPDGEWVAVAIRRGAGVGEVYGRTDYSLDPSRSDISLISVRTGERRQITDGGKQAAGFWCPTWSPDGRRLAMLSTQPEGDEPVGGDNVRLYMWHREDGRLVRTGDAAVMTQTRAGSPLHKLDLRGGQGGGTAPHACHDMENAPFLWIDNDRLLVASLPEGQVSGLIDQYGRAFRVTARNADLVREGAMPSVHAVGSGDARMPRADAEYGAVLRIVDANKGTSQTIAAVPAYPFRGALSVKVSPDLRRIAVLATLGAFQPQAGRRLPNAWDDGWTVERRLGFADLGADATIRWVALPDKARWPLDLFDWSPDSRHVAVRGRADPFSPVTSLAVVGARDGRARLLGGGRQVATIDVRTRAGSESPVIWADGRHLVAKLKGDRQATPDGWWLIDLNGRTTSVTTNPGTQPPRFVRALDGALVTIVGDRLLRLDLRKRTLVDAATLDGATSMIWPQDTGRSTAKIVAFGQTASGETGFRTIDVGNGVAGPAAVVEKGLTIADVSTDAGGLILRRADRNSVALQYHDLEHGVGRDLLSLNRGMADIALGETRHIDYRSVDGKPLKAAVILPPDYRPGQTYPMLSWVYQGYVAGGPADEQWFGSYLPGFYNLQLYAAQGYVVLIPSMPVGPRAESGDHYGQVLQGTMPAIDKLIEMGIADPDRLGVFGQSRGGYTVAALLTQTDRFRAGVAMAGITDLGTLVGQFDMASPGYPGIGHEKSYNWDTVGQFGVRFPPERDDDYARNSPLTHVDRVDTPLLLVHGDADIRGADTQSELFFSALHARGKTAKLLRYGGDSHGLTQSPANIRDIFAETIGWFDRYLKAPDSTGKSRRPAEQRGGGEP